MKYKIGLVADTNEKAQNLKKSLLKKYQVIVDIEQYSKDEEKIKDIEILIVLGGDGFMLHTIHKYFEYDYLKFWGINCGTYGFLTNENKTDELIDQLCNAQEFIIHPLKIEAYDSEGKLYELNAVNEVSLIRDTSQSAHISISINDQMMVEKLIGDGVLVSTPAGSSAYNFSVHGPILPINADLLALTPISPFRPRHWRGAIILATSRVVFENLSPEKRPIHLNVDFFSFKDILRVKICENKQKKIHILFDKNNTLEQKIMNEQFLRV